MAYLIERQRAIRTTDLVAVTRGHWRRVRSQLVLRDNSIYNTLTRPGTLREVLQGTRAARGRTPTLLWRAQQP